MNRKKENSSLVLIVIIVVTFIALGLVALYLSQREDTSETPSEASQVGEIEQNYIQFKIDETNVYSGEQNVINAYWFGREITAGAIKFEDNAVYSIDNFAVGPDLVSVLSSPGAKEIHFGKLTEGGIQSGDLLFSMILDRSLSPTEMNQVRIDFGQSEIINEAEEKVPFYAEPLR